MDSDDDDGEEDTNRSVASLGCHLWREEVNSVDENPLGEDIKIPCKQTRTSGGAKSYLQLRGFQSSVQVINNK